MSDVADLENEPWWWIDYLENEIDPSLDADLKLLLEHSQEDRDAFENFRLLKEWLTDSDPVGNWPLEPRLERVRRGVMAAIENMEMEKPRYLAGASSAAGGRETKSLRV